MHIASLPRGVDPFRSASTIRTAHLVRWSSQVGRTEVDKVSPSLGSFAQQSTSTSTATLTCSRGLFRMMVCAKAEPRTASSSVAPSPAAGDLRLELWMSLLQTSASQIVTAAYATATAATGIATRLQRLSQPPPPNFPSGPAGDQTLALLSDPLRFLISATEQYGPLVGFLLGGERVVLVTGREAARAVLVEQAGSVYVKEGTAFFPGSSLAGNGLLVSDGAVWQRQRRLSNPAFRRAAVEAYSGAMVAATRTMLYTDWGPEGGTRDVYVDFNELTLRVTQEALFGIRAEEVPTRRQPMQPTAALTSPRPSAHTYASETLPGVSVPASTPAAATTVAAVSSNSASHSYGTSSEEAQQIVAAVQKAFTFFTQRAATGFVIPEWLPTWDNVEFAAAVQQLDRVVYGMISRRRQELTEVHGSMAAAASASTVPGALPSDLLTSLLLSRDDDGSGMSDQALRDELMTLLVAGQETSAILLGWATALLAAHPETQARASAEVAQVCGRDDFPTASSVRHMPYLESVVLETLRLYSPAYMVGRCAQVDTVLGSYSLPAGTTVLISPYVMHRDATVWEQPEAFCPERWQELQSREGYMGYMGVMSNLGPNGAYLPFGGGPRNCIGTGFAMMEAMLVLAAVLQRYSLALPSQPQHHLQYTSAPASAVPTSFPKAKPLLTLRPESVVLRVSPR